MGALFLAPLYVAATVLSGSRGGILAGVVALLLLAPLVRRFSLGQLIFLWLTGAAAAYVIYTRFGGLVSSTIQDRIVDLTLNQKYSSGRGDLASGSISLFWENFWIGSGIGGFADYYGQGFTYPHNLVLQIAAEGGLAGCALFLFALGAVAAGSRAGRSSPLVMVFTAAFAQIFVASMFSGGYYDSRFLFIFGLAILATSPRAQDREGDSRRALRPTTGSSA
ncbi:O-antigen ligase family protein [Barrientosiimonas humi]|uniref:O-antigen ligase family protein n=1 Tax=Barrientosiimonas humi TaxID=999931 RepID=UPI00370D67B6